MTDRENAGIALKAFLGSRRAWIYAIGVSGEDLVVYSSSSSIPRADRAIVPAKWMGFKVRVERAGTGMPVQITD